MSKEFPTNGIIIGAITEFPMKETIIGIITGVNTMSGMTGIPEGTILPTEDSLPFPAAGIITTEQSGIRISWSRSLCKKPKITNQRQTKRSRS